MHVVYSQKVDAPVIEEFPLTLECEVEKIVPIGHDFQITAKVVNTLADEDILDENSNVDTDRFEPLVYDSAYRSYCVVAKGILGKAWSVGKDI